MESPKWIRDRAVEDAFNLYQDEGVDAEVSSTFFGSVKEKIDRASFEKMVAHKPKSHAGTSLARAVSSLFGGLLYPGKIILYKPFFSDFDIAIGPNDYGRTKNLNMRQRRAIVVLHELTHVSRRYVDALQFLGMHYFDEAMYDQYTINDRIYEACKDLDSFDL